MKGEVAVVLGPDEEVLHWHLPPDRTAASLPDSRELWEVLWEARATVLGVAHTHPGRGRPVPSTVDLTTFRAVELGLGRTLTWWVASQDRLVVCRWIASRTTYGVEDDADPPKPWLIELRRRSGMEE
ncbi:MAG: hypothetical protein ACFCGT_05900 [Sandaracinaceae bacterium]